MRLPFGLWIEPVAHPMGGFFVIGCDPCRGRCGHLPPTKNGRSTKASAILLPLTNDPTRTVAVGIFNLPHTGCRNLLTVMPHRVKQSRSFLTPLAENFVRRLASTDKRLRRKAIRYGFWILGLLFCYSLMVGTYSLPRIARLELERRALIEANRQLTIELIDAARIREMLKSDPGYIEQIARTRYRMVRPNETIYRYRGQ